MESSFKRNRNILKFEQCHLIPVLWLVGCHPGLTFQWKYCVFSLLTFLYIFFRSILIYCKMLRVFSCILTHPGHPFRLCWGMKQVLLKLQYIWKNTHQTHRITDICQSTHFIPDTNISFTLKTSFFYRADENSNHNGKYWSLMLIWLKVLNVRTNTHTKAVHWGHSQSQSIPSAPRLMWLIGFVRCVGRFSPLAVFSDR